MTPLIAASSRSQSGGTLASTSPPSSSAPSQTDWHPANQLPLPHTSQPTYLGGQNTKSTLESSNPSGTGPYELLSRLWYRSSPSTQQCPAGILTDLASCGGCVRTTEPGRPMIRFTRRAFGSEGELWGFSGEERKGGRTYWRATTSPILKPPAPAAALTAM